MNTSSTSSSNEDTSDRSFFEKALGQAPADSSPDRVQELKRMLFDLAYLVVNADGTEHLSEKMLLQKLERRMKREGSVDIPQRSEALSSLLEKGPAAIRERVGELADGVADRAGDRVQDVGTRYLDFLRGLIVADASVSSEEYELFQLLCDRWGVENDLPPA